ncbi:13123_t:CDS:2 [Ambispora gerdemannii]|uniref:phosphoserine phosphatase n=1 Tax=Ambispora gerdemannii TaxID=144530 RepID=A0A9N9ARK6_9GLOM|nr:13123_t:CDS:2 [Ambispora gerdemannii]
MKFGKYLEERKTQLPLTWNNHCIDYNTLKLFIKHHISLHTLNLSTFSSRVPDDERRNIKLSESEQIFTWKPINSEQPSFSQLISSRLASLQVKIAEFLELLDVETQKVSGFYNDQSSKLLDAYQQQDIKENTLGNLLQSIVKLEDFIFLNYTGLTKILKKHDKHSGLNISEAYLYRVSLLPFAESNQLSSLKKKLMNEFIATIGGKSITNRSQPSISIKSNVSTANNELFPPTALLPNQKVLITLTGPHGTDIIGCVLECVAVHDCEIEDFMFSRLYHNVTFGVLITLTSNSVELFRDLAQGARKWDGTLAFDVHNVEKPLSQSLEDAPYDNRTKYAATILNQNGLTAKFLDEWTKILLDAKISVEKMQRLNEGKISCVDYKLSVPLGTNFEKLREQLFQFSRDHGTDVALQPYDVFRRHKRLVVFDMDSTLIQQEVIDEIARIAGVVDKVATITEAAMNGEIDFKESLRRRVKLLQGTPVNVFQTVKENLTFTEGTHFLCRALKKLGFKLAVISGGFTPLARYVKHELGLDYAFANQLKVSSDGLTLTGETVGPIVDGERKAELLEVIAQAESVTLDQVIAVGDGANDLWMLGKAGLGIAFNAKPRVQEKARTRINQHSLKYVLYLLGYTEEECRQLYLSE